MIKRYDAIIQSPDGTVYDGIDDLVLFCKEHNLSRGCLYMVIHEKRPSHKGWIKLKPKI